MSIAFSSDSFLLSHMLVIWFVVSSSIELEVEPPFLSIIDKLSSNISHASLPTFTPLKNQNGDLLKMAPSGF